jgi:hypothetical protein
MSSLAEDMLSQFVTLIKTPPPRRTVPPLVGAFDALSPAGAIHFPPGTQLAKAPVEPPPSIGVVMADLAALEALEYAKGGGAAAKAAKAAKPEIPNN